MRLELWQPSRLLRANAVPRLPVSRARSLGLAQFRSLTKNFDYRFKSIVRLGDPDKLSFSHPAFAEESSSTQSKLSYTYVSFMPTFFMRLRTGHVGTPKISATPPPPSLNPSVISVASKI